MDSKLVTIIGCSIIVIAFIYYIWPVFRIYAKSRKLSKAKNENDIIQLLPTIYKTYKRTVAFVDNDNKMRTSDYASDYFNLSNLLADIKVNARAISSASGIIIGLGLLGTFLGLVIGVEGINPDGRAEEVLQNIKPLLNGMGAAFMTSIFGMSASSIYIFSEKTITNYASRQLEQICDTLDDEYYISEAEKIVVITNRQNQQLKELFVHVNEDGDLITPGNILRDIYASSSTQTTFMSQFMDELVEKMRNVAIDPLIEKLNDLGRQIQAPGEGLANDVVGQLKQAIGDMAEQLQNTISKDLNQQMTHTIEVLNKFPSTVSDCTGKLNALTDNISGYVTNISTSSDITNSKFNESIAKIKDINESLVNTIDKFNTAITNAGNALSDMRTAANNANTAASSMQSAANSNSQTAANLQGIISSSKVLYDQYDETSKSLEPIFQRVREGLNQYSSTVQQNTQGFLDQYTKTIKETIQQITGAVRELSDTIDDIKKLRK